jgi:hypothetical protein
MDASSRGCPQLPDVGGFVVAHRTAYHLRAVVELSETEEKRFDGKLLPGI